MISIEIRSTKEGFHEEILVKTNMKMFCVDELCIYGIRRWVFDP